MGSVTIQKGTGMDSFAVCLMDFTLHLFQYDPADIAVDAFAVQPCTVFDETAAALGERHIDPVVVRLGVLVIGTDLCVGILFLGHEFHLAGIVAQGL